MKALKSESIFELASLLSRQYDYQEVMRLVTQKASALLKADSALVMMINAHTRNTIKTFAFPDPKVPDPPIAKIIEQI